MQKKFKFNTLILAAGFGTRLGEIGKHCPKGLFKNCNGITVVGEMINNLAKASFNLNIVSISNLLFFKQYTNYYKKNFSELNIKIINNGIKKPENKLGAIGDLIFSIEKMNWWNDDLLVLPSDTTFGFDLQQFVEFSLSNNGFSTVVRQVTDLSEIRGKRGCASLDENNMIIEFHEKPDQPASNYLAVPFYYYPKQYLLELKNYQKKYVSDSKKMDAPGNIIPWFIEKEIPVYAYITKRKVIDVGTPESLKYFQEKKLKV